MRTVDSSFWLCRITESCWDALIKSLWEDFVQYEVERYINENDVGFVIKEISSKVHPRYDWSLAETVAQSYQRNLAYGLPSPHVDECLFSRPFYLNAPIRVFVETSHGVRICCCGLCMMSTCSTLDIARLIRMGVCLQQRVKLKRSLHASVNSMLHVRLCAELFAEVVTAIDRMLTKRRKEVPTLLELAGFQTFSYYSISERRVNLPPFISRILDQFTMFLDVAWHAVDIMSDLRMGVGFKFLELVRFLFRHLDHVLLWSDTYYCDVGNV